MHLFSMLFMGGDEAAHAQGADMFQPGDEVKFEFTLHSTQDNEPTRRVNGHGKVMYSTILGTSLAYQIRRTDEAYGDKVEVYAINVRRA